MLKSKGCKGVSLGGVKGQASKVQVQHKQMPWRVKEVVLLKKLKD